MHILDSAWLLKMLQKSAATPRGRLLALYDILADWTDAPQLRGGMLDEKTSAIPPRSLLDYLAQQAAACGATMPEALAQQLYFIALSALQENLHNQHSNDFQHARIAAAALIAAQTQQHRRKPWVYGIAASMLTVSIGCAWLLAQHWPGTPVISPMVELGRPSASAPIDVDETVASPKQAADLYASAEQMRQGDCRYVEALQIPDADKRVYIENVVGGKIPTNAGDMAKAQRYMQQIQCSYIPMLMKNSVN